MKSTQVTKQTVKANLHSGNEMYCQGTLRAFATTRVYSVHTISVHEYDCDLSVCFLHTVDFTCWRGHNFEVLGPNWTKFSGNVHNNNIIQCIKFGMLKMNRNEHVHLCSFMNIE